MSRPIAVIAYVLASAVALVTLVWATPMPLQNHTHCISRDGATYRQHPSIFRGAWLGWTRTQEALDAECVARFGPDYRAQGPHEIHWHYH